MTQSRNLGIIGHEKLNLNQQIIAVVQLGFRQLYNLSRIPISSYLEKIGNVFVKKKRKRFLCQLISSILSSTFFTGSQVFMLSKEGKPIKLCRYEALS